MNLVHAFQVNQDPATQRHCAVGKPCAASARHYRDPVLVGELDDGRNLLGRPRQHDNVRQVLVPAVHRERRGHPGSVEQAGLVGQHPILADNSPQPVNHVAVHRGGRHALVLPPISIPADSATISIRSLTSIPASSPAALSGRSDHTHALTSVSTSSSAAFSNLRRLISAVISGFSIGSPPPPPEQYAHWVTRSTSLKVKPGIARRISRGAS